MVKEGSFVASNLIFIKFSSLQLYLNLSACHLGCHYSSILSPAPDHPERVPVPQPSDDSHRPLPLLHGLQEDQGHLLVGGLRWELRRDGLAQARAGVPRHQGTVMVCTFWWPTPSIEQQISQFKVLSLSFLLQPGGSFFFTHFRFSPGKVVRGFRSRL